MEDLVASTVLILDTAHGAKAAVIFTLTKL